MRTLWSIVWRWLALVTTWALPLGLGVALLRSFPGQGHSPAKQLAMEAFCAAALLGASWLLVRVVDRRPLSSLGLAPSRAGKDLALGVSLGFAWLALTLLPVALAGALRTSIAGTFSPGLLALVAVSVALNAFTQELLVHGYLFRVVQWRWGPWAALLSTSALFSALHLPAFQGTWWPALNLFLAGTALGVACWRSGQLWLATALHFAWNFGLGPVAGLAVSGKNPYDSGFRLLALDGPSWLAGGSFGLEGSVVVAATTAALLALLLRRPWDGRSKRPAGEAWPSPRTGQRLAEEIPANGA